MQTEAPPDCCLWFWQLWAKAKLIYTLALGRTKSRTCESK